MRLLRIGCGPPTTARSTATPCARSAMAATRSARARRQIRDDLFAKQDFSERDLLAIQLDDRALFLQRWWQLLREQATHAGTPALHALAGASRRWEGRATRRIDQLPHRPRLAARGARAPARRPDRTRAGRARGRLHDARPAAVRRRGLAAGDAASGQPVAASLRFVERVVRGCGHGSPRRARRARPARAAHLGRAQHRAHLPSAVDGLAGLREAPAVHAVRPTRRRQQHAARRGTRLRRQRTHGGVARPRSRRHHPHARRAKRHIRCRRSGARGTRTGCMDGRRRSCRAGREHTLRMLPARINTAAPLLR